MASCRENTSDGQGDTRPGSIACGTSTLSRLWRAVRRSGQVDDVGLEAGLFSLGHRSAPVFRYTSTQSDCHSLSIPSSEQNRHIWGCATQVRIVWNIRSKVNVDTSTESPCLTIVPRRGIVLQSLHQYTPSGGSSPTGFRVTHYRSLLSLICYRPSGRPSKKRRVGEDRESTSASSPKTSFQIYST